MITGVLAYLSSMLFLINFPTSIYAQKIDQKMQGSCGTQVIGNGNNITLICPPGTLQTDVPKKSELEQLCREENFGAKSRPPIFFSMTEDYYNVGEIVSVKYSGACPGKTVFLISPANTQPNPRRNVGEERRSVLVPSYQGEIRFIGDKPSRPGMYVIQSYFLDSHRDPFRGIIGVHSGERSLPFEVRSRY